MAVVQKQSLFSTPMPSLLETPSKIHLDKQNELTEIAYEMINVTEHFATDFQEFKASIAERIDKTERLIRESVMGDMKQQI